LCSADSEIHIKSECGIDPECVCGEIFDSHSDLREHKDTECSHRLVKCKYCDVAVKQCDFDTHESGCDERCILFKKVHFFSHFFQFFL